MTVKDAPVSQVNAMKPSRHIDFINLKSQYRAYQTEIQTAINRVLESGQFIMGPEIAAFENNLQKFTGSKHAITCASGTDALLLAMMAIDVKPSDEIITTPFTFIATGETIGLLGAKPVFVDIDEDTYNIEPDKIAAAITAKTRAIIPVALYGQPADMDEINAIADEASQRYGHKIYVIEDAAQSFGAEYKGRKSCNLSDIGCTSFFPSKPLGCYGDGGALFTNDDAMAAKLKSLRVHGQTKRYYHEYIGINGRMDTLQAAITDVKLKYFAQEIPQRMAIAERYNELLTNAAVTPPVVRTDRTSMYAQYSIRIKNRDALIAKLNAAGVPTAIHYPMPLHLQPCLHYLGYKAGDFPVSEKIAGEILSLPMSPFLSEDDQDYIVTTLLSVI